MQKNLILQLMVVTLFGLGQTIPLDESQYIVKDIHYDYDLVSGKVNKVSYQEGEADQLQHRYEYDGDNRITAVYTSTDGINWTKEANYEYYAHGPLAKAEIGEQKVETQNYAYTLQGWIKGVNGQNFSYALGYNDKDYKAISASSYGGENVGLKATPIATVTGGTIQNPTSTTQNLYNGNIVTWASLNPKINGTTVWTQQFTYDQLSRIKSGTTLSGGDNYKNTYSYDPNGNISTLSRWDKSGAQIDQFSYNYESKGAGYLTNTNKLRSVDDGISTTVGSALSTEDLEDQNIDNYQYDDIGNLNRDTQEDIVNIEWTVYGKVKAVNRVSDPVTKLPLGNKPNLVFEYDASGSRTCKISIDKAGGFTKTFYLRDASGNVMSTYTTTGTSSLIALQEQYLYGSSRLGVLEKGSRSYELTDHLGNVRTVVTDQGTVSSATDYYPFGMTANAYTPNGYRYGFNGKERESEIASDNYDFDERIYDTRTLRWHTTDPLWFKSPGLSSYNFCFNNPIVFTDPSGEYPLAVITTTITGYTNSKVYGAGGTILVIVVPTYKMIVYDVDSKGNRSKLEEFHVTRDGWYNNGETTTSTKSTTTDKKTGKKTTTTTTTTTDNLVNRTTEPVSSEITVDATSTHDYADTYGAYALDPVPAVPTPAGWDVDVYGGPIASEVKRAKSSVAKGVMIHIGGYFTKGKNNKIAGYYGCFGVVHPSQRSNTVAEAEAKSAEALNIIKDPSIVPVGITSSNSELNKVVDAVNKAKALAKKRKEKDTGLRVTIKKRGSYSREKKIVTSKVISP